MAIYHVAIPRMTALLGLALVIACAPASAPPPAAAVPPRPQVEMPYGGRGVAGLVHYAAVEDGYYATNGVDVSRSAVGSTPTLVAAVLSGDAPIGATGQEAVINAAQGGGDVVIIAAQLNAMAASAIAQRDIRSAAELKGKRMGVTSLASPTHTGAILYLRANGLEPQRDVTISPVGGMPELKAAMESGVLESAVITPPLSYALARAGFTELADLSTGDMKYNQSVLFTSRRYLREHPDVVRNILMGYTEAQRAILNDKAAAQRILATWVNVTDPEELDKTYELAVRGFRNGPAVDLDSVQTSIDLIAEEQPAAKSLRASQIVDNALVNEAAAKWGFPTR